MTQANNEFAYRVGLKGHTGGQVIEKLGFATSLSNQYSRFDTAFDLIAHLQRLDAERFTPGSGLSWASAPYTIERHPSTHPHTTLSDDGWVVCWTADDDQ